ncbi:hypothetical protein CW304_22830 [Bacillus sp. UFRGS-B20]|nr:hypothetical protein CW304_22830 [Bacillus sp. UFRGS-B20]
MFLPNELLNTTDYITGQIIIGLPQFLKSASQNKVSDVDVHKVFPLTFSSHHVVTHVLQEQISFT